MKTWYLTRQRQFLECEIVENKPRNRQVKILEAGHKLSGKTFKTHPENVSVGNLYPRVFEAEKKPTDFFEYKGRVMIKKPSRETMVPPLTPYSFQSMLTDGAPPVETAWATGTGTSPPTRKLASSPLRQSSLGLARSVRSPFSCRALRITENSLLSPSHLTTPLMPS